MSLMLLVIKIKVLEITLTNNEIKEIVKVVKPLENKCFWKELPEQLVAKKKNLSIFLDH